VTPPPRPMVCFLVPNDAIRVRNRVRIRKDPSRYRKRNVVFSPVDAVLVLIPGENHRIYRIVARAGRAAARDGLARLGTGPGDHGSIFGRRATWGGPGAERHGRQADRETVIRWEVATGGTWRLARSSIWRMARGGAEPQSLRP